MIAATHGLLMMAVLFGAYFAPSLIARMRRRPNAGAVFALNLFLGWTVLGWIGALVWALTSPNPPRP